MDIRASNNIVHIWTCSDSCYALMELINYLSCDRDLDGSSDMKQLSRTETPVSLVCVIYSCYLLMELQFALVFLSL